jgi:subtilisin family serine protease
MYKSGSNHGTSCAGVIAGEADAVLTVGAAPGCRLLPIQWESDGPFLMISDSKLLTALNFVANKVDVLSNSWGSTPTTLWSTQVTTRITDLARTGGRRGRGIVFLWAAGNENCPIQHTATVDVPHTNGWQQRPDGSWVWIGVETSRQFRNNLVGIPGLMHVAALASNARRSHYSNYGTGIMVCAPTNNIHEYQRLTVQGLGVTTTTGQSGGVTNSFGGTSSATPLTAGVAALTISANPNLTALDVVSILKSTASRDISFDGYPRTPSASFDTNTSWDISPISPFDAPGFSNIGAPEGSWSPGLATAGSTLPQRSPKLSGARPEEFRRRHSRLQRHPRSIFRMRIPRRQQHHKRHCGYDDLFNQNLRRHHAHVHR